MRLVFLIVAGLSNLVKWKRIAKYLWKEQAKILCQPETHLKEGEAKWLGQIFRGHVYHAYTNVKSRGVMVGIVQDVPCVLMEKIIDNNGRYVIVIWKVGNHKTVIVGIYALCAQQNKYWNEVIEHLLWYTVLKCNDGIPGNLKMFIKQFA